MPVRALGPATRAVAWRASVGILVAFFCCSADAVAASDGTPFGALSQLHGRGGCVAATAAQRCTVARGLRGGPDDLAIPRDGRHVYVAADDALVVLARDRRSGALRQLAGSAGCLGQQARQGCARARFPAVFHLADSPDGRFIYSSSGDAIAAFARNRRTGGLHQLPGTAGCLGPPSGSRPCTPTPDLANVSELVVSADGRNLYASDVSAGAVWIFDREPASGRLLLRTGPDRCVSAGGRYGCTAARGIGSPGTIVLSDDGRNAYVGNGGAPGGIAIFRRNRATGALRQLTGASGCLRRTLAANRCGTARGVAGGVEGLALTPSGRWLYSANFLAPAIGVFGRANKSGRLTQAADRSACVRPRRLVRTPCARARGVQSPMAVAIPPSGRSVYVAGGFGPRSLAAFHRTADGALHQLPGRFGCFDAGRRQGCAPVRAMDFPIDVEASPDGANVYVVAADDDAVVAFRRETRTRTPRAALTGVARERAVIFPVAGYDGQSTGLGDADRPATMTPSMAQDVAVTADGALLVAERYGVVRRIGLDGIVTDVAGDNDARTGPSDTPALRQDIGILGAVAALPDGGFAVSGSDGTWRIGPDGTIHRLTELDAFDLSALPTGGLLATDGPSVSRVGLDGQISPFVAASESGEGEPPVLTDPHGVVALPDGGALVADGNIFQRGEASVRRILPDGTIRNVVRVGAWDVAAAPDGSFYVSVRKGIKHFSADGALLRFYSTAGHDLAQREVGDPEKIALLPDGDLAYTAADRVWLLRTEPANPSQRAAVALRGLRVGRDRVLATFQTTTAGTVTLSFRGRRGRLRQVTTAAAAGVGSVSAHRRLPSHGRVVRVTLRDPRGRLAEDRIRAWIGPRLPISDARELMHPLDNNYPEDYRLGRCHRFARRRVDCKVRDNPATTGRNGCVAIFLVQIPRTGVPLHRIYGCRRGFRAHPFRR